MGRLKMLAVLSLGMFGLAQSQPQTAPGISTTDRVRIREAYRLASQFGDRVWPTWHDAPFAFLLVTSEYEYLIHHGNPTADFTRLEADTLLGGPVFYRKRVFGAGMQATFPAVNGVNTIVLGQAENTSDKSSTRWVLTGLHEHFHQLVYSQPGYYADVTKLGLAHGDDTGMWMLNYPFPYDSTRVQEKFSAMTHALLAALAQTVPADLKKKVAAYRRAAREFRESVPAEAERYFAFQLWQEGVARYTELMLGELAARGGAPLPEFSALPDFAGYGAVAAQMRTKILSDLGSLSLAKSRREVVYSVGAAQALLLDRVTPGWKREYLKHRFRLPEP